MTSADTSYRLAVQELLSWHGFAWVHFRPAQNRRGQWSTPVEGDGEGWPDVVAFHPPHAVAIEVKGEHEPFRPGQVEWLQRFEALPFAFAWVLRPSDGLNDLRRWLVGIAANDVFTAGVPLTFGWGPDDVAKSAQKALSRAIGTPRSRKARPGRPVRPGGQSGAGNT